MIELAFMRHGEAVPGSFNLSDEARWLTEKGRTMARSAGRALGAARAIDCIVSSPLSRAVQTAELVAAELSWEGPIVCLECLRSEASPQRALDELRALGGASILAVTHEPIVSAMSSLVLGERQGHFHTAEIRSFDSAGQASWRWRG